MLSSPTPRGVIFDMDGVLCDSEPFICEAACKMFERVHHVRVQPDDFKPFVVTGEDVTRKKPAPDIFLLAAKRLGLGPADCLVVEDAPNGVQAAKAANMRCLGITSSFDEATLRAAGADEILPDLRGAERFIAT